MTLGQDFWDTIVIIIALDSLYNDFNIINVNLLKIKNEIINQIQSMLQLKKAKNISKQTIKVVKDLIIAFKNNNNSRKVLKKR